MTDCLRVVLPNLLTTTYVQSGLVWLGFPVTLDTIKHDITRLAESRSNSGSVEVVGSIPIGSTSAVSLLST